MPEVRLDRVSYFVYCRFDVVPLLLDAVLVVAATAGVVILRSWEFHSRITWRSVVVLVVLALVAWLIVRFGDGASVYL